MQPADLGIGGQLAARVIKTGRASRLLNKVRRSKIVTDKRPTAKEILNAAR
jgi:hypothetical protein